MKGLTFFPVPPQTSRLNLISCLLIALFVGLSASQTVYAQKNSPDIPTVSKVTAIQGATVVQKPGQILEDATVVFRDGVIVAVGKRASIPYDAQVIDGAGLTVYAGFIDALSQIGVAAPESNGPLPDVPDRSNPTFDRAGISPQTPVRSVLKPSDESVDAFRKLGYTAAHSVPTGRMLPGEGGIILLDGADADAMMLQNGHSLFFQFAAARGVYPGTPMGIMSKFRQLYIEATRRMKLSALYEKDPNGMTRPPSDVVHDAFFPVIMKQKPVFVFTSDALEIHRALTLQKELDFQLVLTGLSEGFDTVEKVKKSGFPVSLTLAIPAKPEWAASIKADSLEQILASFDETTRTATFRDIEAEKRNLEAKQLLSRKDFLAMPGEYSKAAIPFSFTSFGVKVGDIRANIREFIAAGLSKDDALAALTVTPSEQLGLSSSMGSVEVGKMANLVVSKGDIFDEDGVVKYVFVGGNKYEYEEAKKEGESGAGSRRRQ